jgi:uncharacterized protein YdcH (DUF465 family)
MDIQSIWALIQKDPNADYGEIAQKAIEELEKKYLANKIFENLSALRKVMDKAEKANKAKDGLRKLLTKLYPDEAHFIYELLQNAQDANKDKPPTEVKFILSEKELIFEHSGRPFTIEDVDAITNIGEGTKIDDPTSIGKFGVGFKSVFAYTDTPEIHSPPDLRNGEPQHFRIRDLMIPESVPAISTGEFTRFVLPFNSKKKPEEAVTQIESGLKNLSYETLLFLGNIKKITYTLSDGNTGSMERDVGREDGITEIRIDVPHKEKETCYWLRYNKDTIIKDENEKSANHTVAVAFKLIDESDGGLDLKDESGASSVAKWNIVPAGNVCIFFPATQETSKLRFCIHAPFASTVARDSIRKDEDGNKQLRDAIKKLVAESLTDIKKRGLLTANFLGILPNKSDGLSDFYEPIREEIVTAFNTEALVPTKSGSHASANTLFRALSAFRQGTISNVIDDKDLALLTNRKDALWTVELSEKHTAENEFFDSLELHSWDESEFRKVFDKHEVISKWIAERERDNENNHNKWLHRLYDLLWLRGINADSKIRLVRIQNGDYMNTADAKADAEKTVYFSLEDGKNLPKLNFVKTETYDAKVSSYSYQMLDKFGVKKYDEVAKIQLRLNKYKGLGNGKINLTDLETFYWEDLKYFINYAVKDSARCGVFAAESFLIGELDGKLEWVTPAQLRIVPHELEDKVKELKIIFHSVWGGYTEDYLDNGLYANFENFLEVVGVKTIDDEYLLKYRANRYIPDKDGNVLANDNDIVPDAREFVAYADRINLLKNVLSNAYFVYGSDKHLHKASEVCIGIMASFEHIHNIPSVSTEYGEIKPHFEDLLKKLGAATYLKIVEVSDGNWRDHTIASLDDYLYLIKSKTGKYSEAAFLIWKSICSCCDDHASYVHTPGRQKRGGKSTLVEKLMSVPWIPQDGTPDFVTPDNAIRDRLPDHVNGQDILNGYSYNNQDSYSYWNSNSVYKLLHAIGFEKNIAPYQKAQSEQQALGKQLSQLPNEGIVEVVKALDHEQQTAIVEALASIEDEKSDEEFNPEAETGRMKIEDLGEDSINNLHVFQQKTRDYYHKALNVKYEPILRRIRTSRGDDKNNLREKYNGICQNCEIQKDSWEITEIFEKPTKEVEFMNLSLCPDCAATYRKLRRKEEIKSKIKNEILSVDLGKVENLPIAPMKIALTDTVEISFTAKHLAQVQTVIKIIEEEKEKSQ